MSGHRPGTGGGALFFRDADAEKVFILAFLLTLPAACWTLDSRKLLPTRFFGSTWTSTNDTAAIATLRNLASCQAQVQTAARIDVDGDGVGEFGTFGEMTGAAGVRADEDGASRGPKVDPPIVSPALANVSAVGVVTKAGYCFRIFLPGQGGGAVHEGRAPSWSGGGGTGGGWRTKRAPGAPPLASPPPPVLVPGTPLTGPVDTDAAERCWCAYAWPVAAGNSGDRIFFVDQDGDVWQSPNAAKTCSGLLGGPAWDAAMPSGTGSVWAPLPAGDSHRGRDGNPWKRMN